MNPRSRFHGSLSSLCAVFGLLVACGQDPAASTPDTSMDMRAVTPEEMGSTSRDMGSELADDMPAQPRDLGEVTRDADMTLVPEDMATRDQGGPVDMRTPPEDMGEQMDAARDDMATLPVDMGMMSTLYVGAGDVFTPGTLQVVERDVQLADGITLSVWSPSDAGEYAVIVFQHGFLLSTAYYDTLLTHIASHGFVVAAPQMYAPGDNPFGKPSAAEEAVAALGVWQGLGTSLPGALPAGVSARVDRLGLVGHSRGSKVIWLNLVQDSSVALAAVGLDPVDGTGGGFTQEPRAIPSGGLSFSIPSLFVGTGLGPNGGFIGPACAPEADGYKSFFAGAQSPAYELVATEYGHLDMLEDQPAGCGFTCQACEDGMGARDLMRRANAGWTVALMRDALQGSASAMSALSDPALAPVVATQRSK